MQSARAKPSLAEAAYLQLLVGSHEVSFQGSAVLPGILQRNMQIQLVRLQGADARCRHDAI